MIKRYELVEEYNGYDWIYDEYGVFISNFKQAINVLIENGWKPLGGIATASPGTKSYLVQAMIWDGNDE